MLNEKSIGKNIRITREKKGITQNELSNRSGIANTIISLYENGKKTPGLITIAKLSEALGVSIDTLVYGDESTRFLEKASDTGMKIVNAICYLWEEGIVQYYEYCNSIYVSNKDVSSGLFLLIGKYPYQIKRLLSSLNEFQEKRDTYSNPEDYIKMLKQSVAQEINTIIKNKN